MAGGKLTVYTLGEGGVNVDKTPIDMSDVLLRRAQNAIRDPLGGESGLKSRPGLAAMNGIAAGDSVLGGIGVPLDDLSLLGTRFLFLGRGPTS